ncbi:hypothetical protein ABK040_005374 [Willaertia magna]
MITSPLSEITNNSKESLMDKPMKKLQYFTLFLSFIFLFGCIVLFLISYMTYTRQLKLLNFNYHHREVIHNNEKIILKQQDVTTATNNNNLNYLKQQNNNLQKTTIQDLNFIKQLSLKRHDNLNLQYSSAQCSHNFDPKHEVYRSCLVYNFCYYNQTFHYFLNSKTFPNASISEQNNFQFHQPSVLQYNEKTRPETDLRKLQLLAVMTGRNEVPERSHLKPKVIESSISDFQKLMKIDRIQWVDKKSFILKKHRCTNSGHCLLETMYPIFSLLSEYFDIDSLTDIDLFDIDKFRDVLLFFMENEKFQCECTEFLSCGEEKYSLQEKQQNCYKMLSGFSKIVTKHPLHLMNQYFPEEKKNEMLCFSNVLVGSAPYGLFSQFAGWKNLGALVKRYRNLAWKVYNVKPKTNLQRLQSKEINLLIYEKVGRRRILRFEELVQHIKEEFSTFKYQHGSLTLDFKVNILITNFDNTTIENQVPIMYNTDIFLSPFGAAGFNSVFMTTGAVLLSVSGDSVVEQDLFHGHMYYQNIMYVPANDKEMIYLKGNWWPHFEWNWKGMRPTIQSAFQHRIRYLISNVLTSYDFN